MMGAMVLVVALWLQTGRGPFDDTIYMATSRDGLVWELADRPLAEHASVPDLIERSDGTLVICYVDFSGRPGPGEEGLKRITSRDGRSWSAPREITIHGKPGRGAAVDPSLIELDDGRLRLYFYVMEPASGDPARDRTPHRFYSAVSEDGVEFEMEPGVRFELAQITDPEVVRVGDEWLMFISRGQETLLARSPDGLAFEQERDFSWRDGGVPGALVLDDGRVRVFGCGREGIVSGLYDPARGGAPEREPGARVERGHADPGPIRRRDGTYWMIVKRIPRR